MQWTGKGKVVVASPGTPVPLAPAAGPAVKVNTIMVSFDSADGTSVVVYVKDNNGNKITSLSSVNSQPVIFVSASDNQLDLRNFQIDASTGTTYGPVVGYGVV